MSAGTPWWAAVRRSTEAVRHKRELFFAFNAQVHAGSLALLLLGSATVAVVHSILPDHWVPLAVVARTQRWSLARVGGISALAAGGHVVASLVLAGMVAVVGLRFQQLIDTQQGHLVGSVLVLTGLGFLAWGLAGHGHVHSHDNEGGHSHEHDPHEHEHDTPALQDPAHGHAHAHQGVVHSHAHSHAVFIARQQDRLARASRQGTVAGRLATIAVPFGVAASPDLTILPIALAASAYGTAAVVSSLAIFAALTIGTFVGLTVVATAAGYQFRGEWLEKHSNTITAIVLIVIGVVAFIGF